MTRSEELAWAAGFFDGEGYVGVVSRKKASSPSKMRRYYHANLSISQVNDAVLKRFQRIVNCGGISGPSGIARQKAGHKPIYYYKVCRQADVLKIFELLKPYLSPVKLAQFEMTFEKLEAIHNRPWGAKGDIL